MTSSPFTAEHAVPVRTDLVWQPHHDWQPHWTRVQGQLSTGKRLDIATWNDSFLDGRYRPVVRFLWLDGRIILARKQDTADTIVIPVDALDGRVIGEAVRRHVLGLYTDVTLVD